jgi:hypothetical protein
MKVMEEDLDPQDTCSLPMIPHLVATPQDIKGCGTFS